MSLSHRDNHRRAFKGRTAVLAFTLYLATIAHSAWGQTADPPTTDPAITGEPLHTVIPVHLDPASGDIKVGRTTYHGANPGLHLLALKRQPDQDPGLWDTADVIEDQVFVDPNAANAFLQNVLANTKDAILIANGVGNYGVPVKQLAANLELFGAQVDLEQIIGTLPFIFIGNGGRNKGGALQRGLSTVPVDGYLALDSTGKNYTFIQTDYVRYSIGTEGTIKIGTATYDVATSYNPLCSGNAANSFHLVIVDRETLQLPLAPNIVVNNTYCTAQSDVEIARLIGDLTAWAGNNEGRLALLASNGHPIPANWNFGTDGDGRFYPLAQLLAKLGGYFETVVYLTPNDTYSLIGAPAPPSYVARARSRARESSSVYPDHPSGQLQGVLARGRGNWYSPLNADTIGTANLDFYDQVLALLPTQPGATPEATFPQYASGSDQQNVFKSISTILCQGCNPRDNYIDTNVVISDYLTKLQSIKGPGGADCSQSSNAALPFCQVWQQLATEFQYVDDIRAFATNLGDLGQINGTNSLFDLINTWQTLQANLPSPSQATAPSLVSPIVNLVLGLGSAAPTPLAPLFGLADSFFNLGMSLTTDPSGNQTASLATPVANLANQAQADFNAQLSTVGTQFALIYQNWPKMNALGTFLASGQSKWSWGASTASQISQAMTPAVKQSMYRSLMSSVYAIGSYLPNDSDWSPSWGQTPLWSQPSAYYVYSPHGPIPSGNYQFVQPFHTQSVWYDPSFAYVPFTYPTDSSNPWLNDQRAATILADGSWLAISLQSSPMDAGSAGHYDPPETLLGTLFTPVSDGGLGVYRPEFYEGWPFPRVTCTQSGGNGTPGGCNWNAGAPSLETLPEPLTKVSIAVAGVSQNGTRLDIQLTIHNSGTKDITLLQISKIALRTLAGVGEARLVEPALPIHIGKLTPGGLGMIALTLEVPPSVNKLVLSENGTANTGEASSYRFSLGQVVFPKK